MQSGSTAQAIEKKERRLLLQASLQQAVIALQGRALAGVDPLSILTDLLRTIVELTGSAGGFIAEQQTLPKIAVTIWRSVSVCNLGTVELTDPAGLIETSLEATGVYTAILAPTGTKGDWTPSSDIILPMLQKVRPALTSVLLLQLPAQKAAGEGSGHGSIRHGSILCLIDRSDGYDLETIDLLRIAADAAAQLLAASRRVYTSDKQPGVAAHLPDAYLAKILTEISGVVWSASLPDLTLRYISPSIAKLTGHRHQVFIERPGFLDEITPPEDQVLRMAAVHEALEGRAFDFTHRLICADGTLRWFRCKADVATDHDGKPVRLDGILIDVTEDRLTLERGRQSDALYRAVVEDQQEAIVRFRPDHTITFANRQYADFYNLAPEDLLGVKLSDLVPPHELTDIFERLDTLSPEQPSCLHEYEKPLPAGNSRWMRWVNRAMYDSHAQVSEYQCVGHDIGDLKRLEGQLENGRELLSLAVVSSGDGIFEWRPDDNYVWLSPRWKELFGFADDELPDTLESWEKLIFEEDRERILGEIGGYLKNPVDVLRSRVRYRHRNGNTVHVDTRIIARTSDNTGALRIVGALSDVTAKVIAEQQISDAIESLSDGFAFFDAEDRMIMHNQRFLEYFPFLAARGNLIGVPFIEMVRHPSGEMGTMPDPEGYVRDRMKQHREGGSFELPLHNGGWVRVSERKTQQGGIVSIWSDITALKQAEARLLEAVATMQEGFLLVGPDEKIILTNQRCREIYEIAGHLLQPGASYRDFLRYGAENGQFVAGADRPDDYVDEVMSLLYSNENVRMERELANGRWVLISQRSMTDGSSVGIRTDLTAQKRREAELEAAHDQLEHQAETLVELAEKLEEARLGAVEANRAKTRFLAHMSHELRTPLNAVLGFTKLMSDELFGPIGEPKYKEYINLIHESGAHLLSLINDVLDLSKIEAGRMELDRRQISVMELAQGSTRLMEGLAKDRQIKLLVQIMPGCDAIFGDERSLKQMVINLLSNALKFTEAGGRVTLSFAQRADGGSALTVIDTGIGMSPQDIVKALDPFGQVDGEIARQHHGTGLGLPLVKAMAEAHGGMLTVDSEPNVGTTITVYLPGEGSSLNIDLPSPMEAMSAEEIADAEIIPAAAEMKTSDFQPVNMLSEIIDPVIQLPSFPSLASSMAVAAKVQPAPEPVKSPPATASSAAPRSNRPRILLAEDNAVNRRLVLDILREMPVEIDCAGDGVEALERIATARYLMVLMDIQMPRMGGIEATERIRGQGITSADLPIVALTAHASEADQKRFMEAGMDGYLAKPFDVMALLKLVQKHLIAARARQNDKAQAAAG